MEKRSQKGSNFMESVIEEVAHLFQSGCAANNVAEIEAAIVKLFQEKLKESFKNGIEVGMKKAAFGKGPAERKQFQKNPYRKQ